MKMLLRILFVLLFLAGILHAQTWVHFEVRTQASFANRSLAVNGTIMTSGGFTLLTSGVGPVTRYAWAPGVGLDTDNSAVLESNGWTATVDSAALQEASASGVLWVNFQPPANAPQEVLVPVERSSHAFALVQRIGGIYVTNTLTLGESVDAPWLRGFAAFDPSQPFWIEDLTTNECTPDGETCLAIWAPDSEAYPLESVTFYTHGVNAGGRFTLHYQVPGQPEMVQSIEAVATSYGGGIQTADGSIAEVTNPATVTGSVAVGSYYWLTRDSDSWNSDRSIEWHYALSAPYPLRHVLVEVMPPPPVPWQTVTFYIAAGEGAYANVHQPSDTRSLTYVGDGVIYDFDTNGNPHHFDYEEWTAEIDPGEPFWLRVGATELSQGETWYYSGWLAINGTQQNWQTIDFQIANGFGSSATLMQLGAAVSLDFTGEYGSIQDYDEGGWDHSFHYERWSAWLDGNRPFNLTVNGTELPAGETWFYNGWVAINGTQQPWHQVDFQIARNFGSAATLSQNGEGKTLEFSGETFLVPDLDLEGGDHSFEYERWTAWLRADQPFTLAINGTPLPENETWFYNGWSSIGGPGQLSISLTLHASRAGHTFTLTSPGGGSWEWSPGDWTGTQTIDLSDWQGQTWQLPVFVFGSTGTFQHNRTAGAWTLADQTTGESASFDPNGESEVPLNLGHWLAPATPVSLNISLSRWGHDLRIRQRNGEEYSITPGSSQGSVTLVGAVAWYNPEHEFDAAGYRRDVAGLDWWVYDADTGEESPMNLEDLNDWISLMPVQNVQASLNGTAVQLAWQVADFLDPEGNRDGGFYIERQVDGGEWTRFNPVSVASVEDPENLGFFYWQDANPPDDAACTYRVAYFYGPRQSTWATSNTVQSPDWDEIVELFKPATAAAWQIEQTYSTEVHWWLAAPADLAMAGGISFNIHRRNANSETWSFVAQVAASEALDPSNLTHGAFIDDSVIPG